MEKYVLGFLFRNRGREVLLIKKDHPQWQKGKYNGIGGHIQKDELSHPAIVREFLEEAGTYELWRIYCKLYNDNFEMDIYFANFISGDNIPSSKTKEKIKWFPVNKLPKNIIPNLPWLIPMALSFRKGEIARKFEINQL